MNFNFTEKLIENLSESSKSWRICQHGFQQFASRARLEARGATRSAVSALGEFNAPRPLKSMAVGGLQDLDADGAPSEDELRTGQRLRRAGSLVGQGNHTEDMISPFVIVNKTDLTMVITRLGRTSEQLQQEQHEEPLEGKSKERLVPEMSQQIQARDEPHDLPGISPSRRKRAG